MGNEVSALELLRTVSAVEAALGQQPAQASVQLQHAWDPQDCSDNMTVLRDGLLVKRKAGAGRTDAVRGREGYKDGIHVWEIHWPRAQRGSHAVVGVASYQCPLACKGHTSLIGSNDESVGWDIARKVLLFNGVVLRKFPENLGADYQVPEVIIVTLNMGEGSLFFKAEDRDYGKAISGLRAIGKLLYPAVSTMCAGAEISIKYLGGSETVRGRGISLGAPLAFHDVCGKRAKLQDSNRTVCRVNPGQDNNGAIVLSSRPLKDDEPFTMRLDTKVPKWTGSLEVGVTTNSPMELEFPDTMTDCKQGHTWMYTGTTVQYNGNTVQGMSADLDSLPVGGKVSVVKRSSGELEFLIDGSSVGQVNLRLYADKPLFGVVDIYGQCSKVTLLGDEPLAQQQQVFEGSVDRVEPQSVMRDVERTVNMLKEKDPSKLRQVHQAVTANLANLYWRLPGRKYRQVIGDQLTDLGLPGNALGYLKFLQRCGLDKDAVRECYLGLLSVIWNFSDNSVRFSTALGAQGLLDFIMDKLGECAGSSIRSKVSLDLVSRYFGVLHNCAKAADNRPLYHAQGFVKMAASFLQHELPAQLAMSILLAMSYVFQPTEKHLLLASEDVLNESLLTLRKAAQQEGRHYYNGWNADELVMGLANLSANEENRSLMLQKGIVDVLVELIRRGNDNEQECALNAVWTLTTPGSRAQILKNPDVKGLLESLKASRVEAVSQAAKRALIKLMPAPVNEAQPANKKCPYFKQCKTFMQSIDVDSTFLTPDQDMCYCVDCHSTRGDKSTYQRGEPEKEYGLPIGWCRFGIKPHHRAFAKEVDAFKRWHRAFHGTKKDAIKNILNVGDLLMPGDRALGGFKMKPRPGHFDDGRKPEGFNVKQVFVSPSIRYAGHDAYATPYNFTIPGSDRATYKARVALQVLIEPKSYTVGPQTVGENSRIDPNFENEELEWMTDSRGCCIIYGILVKLDK